MIIPGVLPVSFNFASFSPLLHKNYFETSCKKAIILHFMYMAEVIKQQYSTGTLKPKLDIIGFQYCCQIILIVTDSSIWSSGRQNNIFPLVLMSTVCNIKFRMTKCYKQQGTRRILRKTGKARGKYRFSSLQGRRATMARSIQQPRPLQNELPQF